MHHRIHQNTGPGLPISSFFGQKMAVYGKGLWMLLCHHKHDNIIYPPTRVGVHSTVYYVASKIWFKIQNPKSKIRNPKSKIQNPKSKIQNPKSEIQNPKSKIRNPKSKIQNPKFAQKEMLHNAPKSKIQNPKSKIQNPKSEIQNPKSKIQNPKSKIQNPERKTRQGRWEKEGAESSIVEPEPYVWAIYVSSFAAVGRNKGYNQLYLIQLGEARKLGNRNERRREGKRWATLPPTVSDTVGFGYLSNVFFCGLLAPSPGNLPGSAATGASLF